MQAGTNNKMPEWAIKGQYNFHHHVRRLGELYGRAVVPRKKGMELQTARNIRNA